MRWMRWSWADLQDCPVPVYREICELISQEAEHKRMAALKARRR